MTQDHSDLIYELLRKIEGLIGQSQLEEAEKLFRDLHPADQAEIFNLLSEDDQDVLFDSLDVTDSADLLEELEDQHVLETIESMSNDELADLLDEMEPDEAADLLGDLPPEQMNEVLLKMEEADDVLPLLGHPDETAGGLMTTTFIALRRQTTVEQAIQFLRAVADETEIPFHLFVVDISKKLTGVVSLRDLVISSPAVTMSEIMDTEMIYVHTGVDQEEAARIMTHYDMTNLPVVDEDIKLVGVITHDDILDVMEDEATEDILRLGAVDTGPGINKPYWSIKVFDVVRSRFFWLMILFIAQIFSGFILRHYQNQIEMVVALSFFIPLLIGTGGNAGSQTVNTVIRALALQEIRPKDALKVWWREGRSGLLLGLLIGVLALISLMVLGFDFGIAITVGLTVTVICTWATSVASLIPILASALKIDPTITSGPMMSTLIDGSGLIIYFTMAGLILPQFK